MRLTDQDGDYLEIGPANWGTPDPGRVVVSVFQRNSGGRVDEGHMNLTREQLTALVDWLLAELLEPRHADTA